MTITNISVANTDAGLLDTGTAAGAKWTTDITYSIPAAGAVWDASYANAPFKNEPGDPAFGVLNGTQGTNYGLAAELWDSYIAISMTSVTDSTTPGDIR